VRTDWEKIKINKILPARSALPQPIFCLSYPYNFPIFLLDLIQNEKFKQKDHRRLMQIKQPGKKQKILTIESEVTLVKQLVAILVVPVMLVFFFWAIFIIENEGGDLSSDFLSVLVGCFYKMLSQGCTECVPDLGYIILCTIIGGPLSFVCSYKIWHNLKSKIILTDQRIVQKQAFGKEIQLYWRAIKKIKIIEGAGGTQLVLTNNKGSALLGDTNRIFCPPTQKKGIFFIPPDAANLILKKIDRYKITVKGDRTLLEDVVQPPHQSQQASARPVTPNINGTNHLPAGPSSPHRPTPR
jgi:hypothetical protein